jgi:DHA2 family multidrug resistance protein
MIATYVHDSEHQRRSPSVDYMGIGLLVVSVASLQYLLEYGQREDWFQSKLMIGLAVAAFAGGAALVWRELTTDHPVIDFRVLRHRQMWVGTVLGIVMGVGLFASVFTLPVFMQNNLRMTAQQTGIVLLPGALATAVSMAVVGRLVRKYDPRLLIASGAAMFVASMWQLAEITSDSGPDAFFVPLILRGLGLGFMFVPLTTVTLAELARAELPQGTALFNFFRQLGGSLGIAGVATIVSHDTVKIHAVLTEHITTTDPGSLSRLTMLTRGFVARGADAGTAMQRAYTVLDRQVLGQASVIAYSHSYLIAAFLVFALIPLLVLVRQTKGAAPADVMME